jgi:hypothetical protein
MSEKSSPAARLLFLVLWLWHLSIAVCGEAALVSHTPKVSWQIQDLYLSKRVSVIIGMIS